MYYILNSWVPLVLLKVADSVVCFLLLLRNRGVFICGIKFLVFVKAISVDQKEFRLFDDSISTRYANIDKPFTFWAKTF